MPQQDVDRIIGMTGVIQSSANPIGDEYELQTKGRSHMNLVLGFVDLEFLQAYGRDFVQLLYPERTSAHLMFVILPDSEIGFLMAELGRGRFAVVKLAIRKKTREVMAYKHDIPAPFAVRNAYRSGSCHQEDMLYLHA